MPSTRPPTQLESLFAGVVAGAVEGAVTYPAEFTKTVAQFHSKGKGVSPGIVSIVRDTIRTKGIRGMYSGAGALIVGNGAKAGVRFMTFDGIKGALKDPEGRMTKPRVLLAGLCAGVVEAVIAVTPSETIKTKLIDDASSLRPRYTNMLNGTVGICRTEGIAGVYRGLWPTIMKQGANSAVRFSSYGYLQGLALARTKPENGKLGAGTTFGVGAIAGLITVYTTMPLDNIKTRMQALDARSRYTSSLDCVQKIIREEGVARLWGGTTPRLARLMLSGGIVFTVYEEIVGIMTKL